MKIRLGNGIVFLNLVTFIVTLVSITFSQDVLRIIFGIPFILVCPGYALLIALFPRKGDIGVIERTALSFALSIAIAPLLGLIVNFSPWDITLGSTVFAVAVFVFITSIIALSRMRKLPIQECFTIEFTLSGLGWGKTNLDKVLTIALVIVVLGSLGTLGYVLNEPKLGESFTEFYILGEKGETTDYPNELAVGEEGTVILGIVNHEDKDVTYSVEVIIGDKKTTDIGPVQLADNERWEDEVRFTFNALGPNQMVEFVLYKEGEVEPYLSPLYLLINISGVVHDQANQP